MKVQLLALPAILLSLTTAPLLAEEQESEFSKELQRRIAGALFEGAVKWATTPSSPGNPILFGKITMSGATDASPTFDIDASRITNDSDMELTNISLNIYARASAYTGGKLDAIHLGGYNLNSNLKKGYYFYDIKKSIQIDMAKGRQFQALLGRAPVIVITASSDTAFESKFYIRGWENFSSYDFNSYRWVK